MTKNKCSQVTSIIFMKIRDHDVFKGIAVIVIAVILWLLFVGIAKISEAVNSFQNEDVKKCSELVQKDKIQLAKVYCKKSVENGDKDSFYNMGIIYLQEKNVDEAVKYLTLSAKNDNSDAYITLAQLYKDGRLVEKDEALAYLFYSSACTLQNKNSGWGACEGVDILNDITEKEKKTQKENEEIGQGLRILLEEVKKEKANLKKQRQELAQKLAEDKQKSEQEQQDVIKEELSYVYKGLFYEGLAKAKTADGHWGYVNKDDKFVIEPIYQYTANFYDGLGAVRTIANKWGFVDHNGVLVILPTFACVGQFSENLAAANSTGYFNGKNCVDGKWGFINKSGDWVINPVLDSAAMFKNGKARITYQGHTGYIDRYGQWVD